MDMVVGAEPPMLRKMDPPLKFEACMNGVRSFGDLQGSGLYCVLRSAGKTHLILARRQVYVFAVCTLHLRLEEEVWIFIY